MDAKRKLIIKAITLMGLDSSENIEELIHAQSKDLAGDDEDDLISVYEKLAFERLGEIKMFSTSEEAMEYLRKEKETLWESSIYSSYKHKEMARRYFQTLSSTQGNKSGIKCRACKKENVSFYIWQNRSADEGSTTFYTCMSCGNKWSEK
jgi:DNA-directed RNA polymerase subunit M/transcription elongation factor TFIIS